MKQNHRKQAYKKCNGRAIYLEDLKRNDFISQRISGGNKSNHLISLSNDIITSSKLSYMDSYNVSNLPVPKNQKGKIVKKNVSLHIILHHEAIFN